MLIICAHWATPVNAYWIASVDGFLNEHDVLYDCSILKTCFWSKTCFPDALWCPVSWAREQQFMKRNSSADNNAPSCGGYLSILRKVALLWLRKHDDWMLWQRVFVRRLDFQSSEKLVSLKWIKTRATTGAVPVWKGTFWKCCKDEKWSMTNTRYMCNH